jgi:hypothetical protein
VGGLASGYVGSDVYEWARDEVVEQFYERPMDPTAEMAGRLVGGVVGGSVSTHYGVKAGQAIRFAWECPSSSGKSRLETQGSLYNGTSRVLGSGLSKSLLETGAGFRCRSPGMVR